MLLICGGLRVLSRDCPPLGYASSISTRRPKLERSLCCICSTDSAALRCQSSDRQLRLSPASSLARSWAPCAWIPRSAPPASLPRLFIRIARHLSRLQRHLLAASFFWSTHPGTPLRLTFALHIHARWRTVSTVAGQIIGGVPRSSAKRVYLFVEHRVKRIAHRLVQARTDHSRVSYHQIGFRSTFPLARTRAHQ